MSQKFSRDQLVARMVRAGELEVSGEAPDELAEYFAPDYRFHGPGGRFVNDYVRVDNHSVLAQLGHGNE